MIWHSIEAMTIVDILIVAGVGLVIGSFIRTHGSRRSARPNFGLLFVLFGLSLIAGYYLINLATLHLLPLFTSDVKAWSVLRSLHMHGYWLFIGIGLLCLLGGLHMLNRRTRSILYGHLPGGGQTEQGAMLTIPQISEFPPITEEPQTSAG